MLTVLVSLIVHALACGTLVLVEQPPDPPPPEPQPMAVMVEFVPDPTVKEEKERQEIRKGDPGAVAEQDAAPETNDLERPVETAKSDAFIPPDMFDVPIPVLRPKPEPRKTEKKFPDKTRVATARGVRDDPPPDVMLADTLRAPGTMQATLGEETVRGVVMDAKAQERWHMQLSAHLERRKRYPLSALSRREEGIVYVRFSVAPDGTVIAPEIAQSSDVPDLDREVLDLLQRASPVPKPPSGISTFVTVPVSFRMKR